MKSKVTLLAAFLCLISINSKALFGGPDLFGYVWLDSDESGGPTYNWIDITSVGTQITDFTDDNGVTNIPLGFNFHYYWTDYSNISIGSNGWLSFNNIGNIASCFPEIPEAGGVADDIIAPFMTDLIFETSSGSTGAEAWYYYDGANDQFIVSFINVPWWSGTNPNGYVGSNTFQVILSGADSSITFNYMTVDSANYDNTSCTGVGQSSLEIGIENITGGIGLQVYHSSLPPNSYAVKFFYPPVVTYQAIDPNANWNMGAGSKGMFIPALEDFTLTSNVKNVGNTAVSNAITVSGSILNTSSTNVFSASGSISVLAAGDDSTVVFAPNVNLSSPGEYTFNTSITNTGDVNTTNNVLESEIRIVDTTNADIELTYTGSGSNNGSISWTGGGGGAGVYYVPPIYPVEIQSVEAFVINGVTGAGAFLMEVLDDDGPSGMPGTVLSSEVVPTGSYSPNTWVESMLTTPVTINSGGFYVSWQMLSADSVGIGTQTVGPFSRQNLEYLGSWTTFRYNEINELMLKANVVYPFACSYFQSTLDSVHNSCPGANDGEIFISYTGGTPNFTVSWDNGTTTGSNLSGLSGGLYNITITDSIGCVETLSAGLIEYIGMTLTNTTTDEITGSDGSIDLSVSGFFNPFTYDWDNDGVGDNDDPEDLTGLTAGTYIVIVTDANGCTASDTIVVGSQIGIEELGELQFDIYPNPAKDLINLDFDQSVNGNVVLQDLSGRIVFSRSYNTTSMIVDVSNLSAGTYVLTVESDGKIGRRMIEIQ